MPGTFAQQPQCLAAGGSQAAVRGQGGSGGGIQTAQRQMCGGMHGQRRPGRFQLTAILGGPVGRDDHHLAVLQPICHQS
ncbi:hypothetical protein C6A86_027265 [Mycobacterium sp. ITM-2016-00316]|uniref:hypothetical protein n=1 Tax=Mycobacterium sp. ITM-2016-00316 TaxID=2099695 RepID=UPI00287FD171|nr:hypothetical protein [Mycobacterium sp. ITM-2016-00316]WNG85155.1 hypothetical protein C6A86_027265 [Mycobacterium sp. ITM-2016-00316]